MKINNISLKVKDPRKARGKRYSINAILHAVVAGLISGRNTLKSIWRFCKGLTHKQKKGLGFCKGVMTCYSNITIIMRQIDPQELQAAINNIDSDSLQSVMSVMHTDGKTMRGSSDITHDMRKVLSAYNPDKKTVVAHEEIKNFDEQMAMIALVKNHDLLTSALFEG